MNCEESVSFQPSQSNDDSALERETSRSCIRMQSNDQLVAQQRHCLERHAGIITHEYTGPRRIPVTKMEETRNIIIKRWHDTLTSHHHKESNRLAGVLAQRASHDEGTSSVLSRRGQTVPLPVMSSRLCMSRVLVLSSRTRCQVVVGFFQRQGCDWTRAA